MTDEADVNPGHLVTAGVQTCLELARTWHAWDVSRPGSWTLREIAEHVAGVSYYAEQVGSLA